MEVWSCQEETVLAHQEVVAQAVGEVSVEGEAVVAGWEVTVPGLALMAIVSAPVAGRDCLIK